MRILVVLAIASILLAGLTFVSTSEIEASPKEKSDGYAVDLEESDEEGDIDLNDIFGSINQRGMVASWQARRQLKKILKQMPCGWEQYGIPPLAPYKLREGTFNFERGILDSLNKVFRLRIDGLDNVIVKKFKVNVMSKKIKFKFLLPKISFTAENYETNTTYDALNNLGLFVNYLGDGSIKFSLQDISAIGVIKGKVPVLFGSAKLTKFDIDIKVGKCNSDITGFVGGDSVQQKLNKEIENFVEKTINENTQKISNYIEATLQQEINPRLKGKDFWTLVSIIFSDKGGEGDPIDTNCVPPADDWD